MRAGGTSGAVLGCGGSREHILPDDLSRFHAGKDGGSKSRGAVSKGRPKDPPHVHKCFFRVSLARVPKRLRYYLPVI